MNRLKTSRPLFVESAVELAAVQGTIVEMARAQGLTITSVIDVHEGVHIIAVDGPPEKLASIIRYVAEINPKLGLDISVETTDERQVCSNIA